jgi:serine phosphatase RsbU (regulator of sigma subunit)
VKQRLLIAFIFGLFMCNTSYDVQAQKRDAADSLLALIPNLKTDSAKAAVYSDLGWGLRYFNVDSALAYCDSAIHFSQKAKQQLLEAQSIHFKGSIYLIDSKYLEGIVELEKSLEIKRKLQNSGEMLTTLINLAIAHEYVADFKKSLTYCLEALEVNREVGSKVREVNITLRLGSLYYELGREEKSEQTLEKALELARNSKDLELQANATNNLGTFYMGKGDLEKAVELVKESIDIEEKRGNFIGMIEGKTNLGIANYQLGNKELAYNSLKEVMDYYLERTNDYQKSTAVNNVGYYYFMEGEYAKCIEYMQHSLEFAKKAKAKLLVRDRYAVMADAYSELGNFKLAFENHQLFVTMKDSILNEENLRQMNDMEAKYQHEKKEAEIAKNKIAITELKRKEAVANEEIAKKNAKAKEDEAFQQLLFFGLGALLLVVILIAIGFVQKRKANLLLASQKKEIQEKSDKLAEAYKDITDSVRYAERIQTALLTSDEYWKEISNEHFVLLKPKDVVSGDFFWAYQTSSNLAIWTAADCTGHGVPGAFMSMLGIGFLNEIVVESNVTNANGILDKLREKIIKALAQKGVETQRKDGIDLALCVWDKTTNALEFSGANNPLWIVRSGALMEYKPDKMPVGYHDDLKDPFSSHKIQLEKGDAIYVFSDGYADQFGGPKGKKFKYAQFKQLLVSIQEEPMEKQKELINRNFEEWRGELEQIDDVCVIGVKV